MTLPLLYFDNSLLRKKSLPIEKITEEIRILAAKMIETMDHNRGCGLAAVQIGTLLQMFVIRHEKVGPDGEYLLGEPEIFINPKLSLPSEETEIKTEGCLSIPQVRADVERPLSIHVKALNMEGHLISERISGFKARQIMHENDHLHGTLFIDRISHEQKELIKPQLQEIKRKYLSS